MINFFPELKKRRSDGLASVLGLEDLRNPYEIYFGLFGEDDSGGGSDNVDRSNPAEMAARERAAARAGTVTDKDGNPVTSNVYDDSGNVVGQNVVTAGTQGQQVAAREAFNAATGNERSNFAQDQYDQVRAREDAALQRAAAAGRLAGSDRGADVSAINQALGVGDVTSPDLMLPDELAFTQGMSGTVPTISPAEELRQATARLMGDDPTARAPLTVAQQAALDEQTRRSDAGLIALAQQREKELLGQRAIATLRNNLGITTSPTATAASVLDPASAPPADMRTATTLPTPAGTVRALQRARDDASMLEELRTTAPAPGGITTIQGPTAEELINVELPSMADAETRDPFAPSGYDARGLPTGLQTFTNNRGITATTNLAGLTQAQRDNLPGYMNPERGGLQDTIFGNPLDTAYGYELDAQGNVTGILGRPGGGGMVGAGMELLTNALLGPPESVEDLLNRSVYTGFGPGSQVGMDGSDDGREMSKPPIDPCPEGFVLKDGVCTPVDQAGDDAGGPGDFIIRDPAAPPTFQPITQATPVNQINPFVLQPYTPVQAQNIGASRVAQGIQGVSPTGAALGRQI